MRGRAAAWVSKINSLQNGGVIRKQSPDTARTNSTYQRYKRKAFVTLPWQCMYYLKVL